MYIDETFWEIGAPRQTEKATRDGIRSSIMSTQKFRQSVNRGYLWGKAHVSFKELSFALWTTYLSFTLLNGPWYSSLFRPF